METNSNNICKWRNKQDLSITYNISLSPSLSPRTFWSWCLCSFCGATLLSSPTGNIFNIFILTSASWHYIPRINNSSHGTLCHWTFLLGKIPNIKCWQENKQLIISLFRAWYKLLYSAGEETGNNMWRWLKSNYCVLGFIYIVACVVDISWIWSRLKEEMRTDNGRMKNQQNIRNLRILGSNFSFLKLHKP